MRNNMDTKFFMSEHNSNQQTFDRESLTRQTRAASKIKILGIISLIMGVLITLAWLPFGPWAGSAGIMAMVLAFPAVIIEIICFVLLDVCIYIKKRNKLTTGGLLVMPTIGFLLSCSLWIFTVISIIFH